MKNVVMMLAVATIAVGCGGGEESKSSDLNGQQNNSTNLSSTTKVYAQGSFQSTGLSLKAGQKIKITSTGQVTVGLIDASDPANPKLKYYDAAGGDHYSYDYTNSRWIPVVSSFDVSTGFQVGQTGIKNRLADGTAVDYPITVANATFGPMCSSTKRAVKAPNQFGADFLMGKPLYFVEPNRCVRMAKHGTLIMKIVPINKSYMDVEPVVAGKLYESAPYIVPSDGVLYFAVNDALYIDDNQGEFNVTTEILE